MCGEAGSQYGISDSIPLIHLEDFLFMSISVGDMCTYGGGSEEGLRGSVARETGGC